MINFYGCTPKIGLNLLLMWELPLLERLESPRRHADIFLGPCFYGLPSFQSKVCFVVHDPSKSLDFKSFRSKPLGYINAETRWLGILLRPPPPRRARASRRAPLAISLRTYLLTPSEFPGFRPSEKLTSHQIITIAAGGSPGCPNPNRRSE
jgi:hypothetical protein